MQCGSWDPGALYGFPRGDFPELPQGYAFWDRELLTKSGICAVVTVYGNRLVTKPGPRSKGDSQGVVLREGEGSCSNMPREEDERLSWLVDAIGSLVGLSHGGDARQTLSEDLSSSREVSTFLDDRGLQSLKAVVNPGSGRAEFTCKLGSTARAGANENTVDVVFVKRGSEPLSPDNMSKALEVHSSVASQGSALDSLYNTLRAVWCPTLLQNSEQADKLPPRVQQLLSELEQTLSSAGGGRGGVDDSLENIVGIHEPADEFRFWMQLKEDRRSPARALAKAVDQSYADVVPGFASLLDAQQQMDMNSALDLVSRSFDAINAAWLATSDGVAYPQRRMTHFLDCVGRSLCLYLQRHLSA